MTQIAVVAHRPSFTVTVSNQTQGAPDIGYDANHIAFAMHEGRYVVTFLCSGSVTIVPADRVKAIAFNVGKELNSAQWCASCDQPLRGWPGNDPEYRHGFHVSGEQPVAVCLEMIDGGQWCGKPLPCADHSKAVNQ